MHPNPVAENVLGTMGTIFWTIQLLPQIWKSWREKSTEGLSEWLVFLWGISCAPYGTYAIVQNLNIPLILQPQLFGLLSIVSWGQCQYYTRKRSLRTSILMTLGILAILGAFQVAMVFTIRPLYPEHESARRGLQFLGIFSSVLISLALLPQYYEIYKRKEVVGISLPFMFIDLLGGLCSDLSLVFKDYFDVVASVTYTVVIVMDAIVLVTAMILNPLARRKRQQSVSQPATINTPVEEDKDNPQTQV